MSGVKCRSDLYDLGVTQPPCRAIHDPRESAKAFDFGASRGVDRPTRLRSRHHIDYVAYRFIHVRHGPISAGCIHRNRGHAEAEVATGAAPPEPERRPAEPRGVAIAAAATYAVWARASRWACRIDCRYSPPRTVPGWRRCRSGLAPSSDGLGDSTAPVRSASEQRQTCFPCSRFGLMWNTVSWKTSDPAKSLSNQPHGVMSSTKRNSTSRNPQSPFPTPPNLLADALDELAEEENATWEQLALAVRNIRDEATDETRSLSVKKQHTPASVFNPCFIRGRTTSLGFRISQQVKWALPSRIVR